MLVWSSGRVRILSLQPIRCILVIAQISVHRAVVYEHCRRARDHIVRVGGLPRVCPRTAFDHALCLQCCQGAHDHRYRHPAMVTATVTATSAHSDCDSRHAIGGYRLHSPEQPRVVERRNGTHGRPRTRHWLTRQCRPGRRGPGSRDSPVRSSTTRPRPIPGEAMSASAPRQPPRPRTTVLPASSPGGAFHRPDTATQRCGWAQSCYT